MAENKRDDSLLELFIFETLQNTEQLEKIILETGSDDKFSDSAINEIFRIMHTIKGSAAMMSYAHISTLAHKTEDLFFFIRETPSAEYDIAVVSDFVLSFIDFINSELDSIRQDAEADTERAQVLSRAIEEYLTEIKAVDHSEAHSDQNIAKSGSGSGNAAASAPSGNAFQVVLYFEEGCEMENIRAYAILLEMGGYANVISYTPADIEENDSSADEIKKNGFTVIFESEMPFEELEKRLSNMPFIRDADLTRPSAGETSGKQTQKDIEIALPAENNVEKAKNSESAGHERQSAAQKTAQNPAQKDAGSGAQGARKNDSHQPTQSIISVQVTKLDKLMNLVGELVISESMVVENPDLKGLELSSFQREAMQLHKIINEMQELVMSMRLMPLATTFQKTNRIVRDMSRKLGKDVKLNIIGEETEVDKNIIEHLSDPLLHLVRNCIDHGIESGEERVAAGKPEAGTVTLEAYNSGSYVYIIVSDDGRGLNKDKILDKAIRNNLLKKSPDNMTDREIYSLIFLPGFSTNEAVTEYSGRGVGMDVVMQSITSIGGNVSVDSTPGKGTSVIMKIPLTVAIIEGMNISVGDRRFTIPISSIRESFKPDMKNVIKDVDGNEMIMVRGECYAIVRLHKVWGIETDVTDLSDGILVMVEQDDKRRCVFADSLIGQQQVVVKTMPELIKRSKLAEGIAGCTLLGDGGISLIFDMNWLVNFEIK